MNQKTFGDIRAEVEEDLDLENEEFISPDALVRYCNNSISEAEAVIQKLNEDYFLKTSSFVTVANQNYYALPTDCYINKIRKIIYNDGSKVYTINRLRRDVDFEYMEYMDNNQASSEDYWEYILFNQGVYDPLNPLTSGILIRLVPKPLVSGSTLKINYIRQASKVPLVTAGSQALSDAAYIDIPEFHTFIIAATKAKCVSKEGHPKYADIVGEYQYQKKMMIDTLTQRTPDNDDKIEMDMSSYNESM